MLLRGNFWRQFINIQSLILKIDIMMKKGQKKNENDKVTNYKNIIAQYYQRDPHLSDIKQEINNITPEIQILDQLNEFEKKIDALIKTKRYDVQQLYMKPPQQLKRLLRIKVQRENAQGQHILKLFGYIYPKRQEASNCKFTSFFRQITLLSQRQKIVLENWKKPTNNFLQKDGIIIKLPNNPVEDHFSIYLTLISNPPKFQVDPLLQKIVGMRIGTRVQVLDAFWLYVKCKKLQDVENKQIINSDQLIRQAFKTQKLTFGTINHRVRQLLIPVDPIKISINQGEISKVFDIIVEIEQKPNVDIVPFFSQKLNEEKNDHPFLSQVGKIKKCENKFRDHSEKLRRHLAKRNLYKNFKSEKIEELIMQQQKLLIELKKSDASEDYNRLQYILENEDELQKQIKHYFEQINTSNQQN